MKLTSSHISRIFILLAAVCATLLLTLFLERYKESGSELLADKSFSNGFESWTSTGNTNDNIVIEKDGVLLLKTDVEKNISVSQKIPTPPTEGFLKLSAYISTENVTVGPKMWNKARLILDRRNSSGNWQKLPHHTASIDGTTRWHYYEQVFRMVPDTSHMYVSTGLAKATGSMRIRDISLKQVSISPLFVKTRLLVFMVWAGILIWLFSFYANRHAGILLSFMTFVILAAILAGTLAPSVTKTKAQGAVKEYVSNLTTHLDILDSISAMDKELSDHPYDLYISRMEIGKVGHFILFGLLTFLFLSCRSKIPTCLVIADISLLACATELLQFFTEGRTPKLYDLGLDLGGLVTGLFLFLILARYKNKTDSRIKIPMDI